MKFFQTILAPLIPPNHFKAAYDQTCTDRHTEAKKMKHVTRLCSNPKTYPKHCAEWLEIYENLGWTFRTFTCWASPFLVLLLYFFSLERYHTTTYTATYVEHPLTNSPPFALLGNAFVLLWYSFCHQIDFKNKIPEIYLLYQFRSVLPKMHPNCTSKIYQIFVQTSPKQCLKPSTTETWFGGFFSIIPINFNKNVKLTLRIILPTAKHLSLETHVVLLDSKCQLSSPCLIWIHRGAFIGV